MRPRCAARARPGRRRLLALLALAVGLPAAAPARAHEYWLEPSTFAPHAGDTVTVSAFAGTGFRGERRACATARVVRLAAFAAGREVRTAPPVDGDSLFLRAPATDGDGMLFAYESNAADIELPPAEFDSYLEEAGLDRVLAARRAGGAAPGPGREHYARCAKSWIAGRAGSGARSPAGLTLELLPLADPARARTLAVRAMFRGAPIAGVLVRAWRRPLGPRATPLPGATRDSVAPAGTARTDAHGVARLDTSLPGEWLLSCVHMVPAGEPAAGEWLSWWASLTFARPDRP